MAYENSLEDCAKRIATLEQKVALLLDATRELTRVVKTLADLNQNTHEMLVKTIRTIHDTIKEPEPSEVPRK